MNSNTNYSETDEIEDGYDECQECDKREGCVERLKTGRESVFDADDDDSAPF